MADSTIRLGDDTGNSGKYLATETFSHDGQTAHAEAAILYDGSGNQLATATNPAAVDYGVPTATTGTMTTTGSNVTAAVTGCAAAIIQTTGTYAGCTWLIQASVDGGTNYIAVPGVALTTSVVGASWTPGTNATALLHVPCSAYTHVRLQGLVHGSGTANITIVPSAAPFPTVPPPTSTDAFGGNPPPGMLFNGTTWDRERGNVDGTAFASAARTTTTNVDITNWNSRGIHITLIVSSAGTGSVTPGIYGLDAVTGTTTYLLHTAFTAVTANGTYAYELYPGSSAAASGGVTARNSSVLPRRFRIAMTHNNANSMTYSVGYSLIV